MLWSCDAHYQKWMSVVTTVVLIISAIRRKLASFEIFTVCTNLAEMALLHRTELTTAKKKLPPVGLDLMQEIVTGSGVQCLIIWAKLACAIWGIFKLLFMHHLIFGLGGTEDLAIINRAWLCKDLGVLDLQTNVSLAHMVSNNLLHQLEHHWGFFFLAVVNSFEYNNAISANFVQTVTTRLFRIFHTYFSQ